jgi:phosphoribosylanthranilate isomerase
VARQAAGQRKFLVAGGLNPYNVAGALTVSGAFGADVSSGVENAPGVKDPAALRALFAAVAQVVEGRRL